MERCGCSIVRALITEPDFAKHRRRLKPWLVSCGFICAGPGDITLVCARASSCGGTTMHLNLAISRMALRSSEQSGGDVAVPLNRCCRFPRRLLEAIGKDGCRDPADAIGVADCVDLDDPAAGDGKSEDGEGSSTHGDDRSGSAIHQYGMELGPRQRARILGHRGDAVDQPGGVRTPRPNVGTQHDVGMQHCDEALEVTRARSRASRIRAPQHGRLNIGASNLQTMRTRLAALMRMPA